MSLFGERLSLGDRALYKMFGVAPLDLTRKTVVRVNIIPNELDRRFLDFLMNGKERVVDAKSLEVKPLDPSPS